MSYEPFISNLFRYKAKRVTNSNKFYAVVDTTYKEHIVQEEVM